MTSAVSSVVRGVRAADFCGIGSGLEFVPDEIAIVLDDERAAVGDIVEQALVGAGEFGAKFVGADADDDGVVFGEIAEVEGGGVEHIHIDAEAFEGFGDGLAFGRDVADA